MKHQDIVTALYAISTTMRSTQEHMERCRAKATPGNLCGDLADQWQQELEALQCARRALLSLPALSA